MPIIWALDMKNADCDTCSYSEVFQQIYGEEGHDRGLSDASQGGYNDQRAIMARTAQEGSER